MRFVENPTRFTADDAFEASEMGEPILLTCEAVNRIIARHDIGEPLSAFYVEVMPFDEVEALNGKPRYDAAAVLGWLGY